MPKADLEETGLQVAPATQFLTSRFLMGLEKHVAPTTLTHSLTVASYIIVAGSLHSHFISSRLHAMVPLEMSHGDDELHGEP